MMSTAAGDTIRTQVLRGLAWKSGSQLFVQVSRVAVGIILARLLSPSDYGIAAMVLVASSLVQVFADLALGAALIQRRQLTEADRSTVFWLTTAAGVTFTALGVALAGPVASFYGEPSVEPLFVAFSIGFAVTALGSTHAALLTREMRFRSLELRQMVGVTVGASAGITVATLGHGPWAIIAQQLAIACTSTALLWSFSEWRPSLTFSTASLRQLGGFGANVLGARLLFYLNRNLDNLLIGRFLGPAALGAYALSYQVMLAPFTQIAQPIQQVLLPAFSRMQDERERLSAGWIRVNRLIGAISIPALTGLVIVAPEFVQVVLGERWSAAVPVIQILAWVGLIQSLQRLNSSILQALDRTRDLLRYAVVVLVASSVAFVIGLQWGIVGVAVAYAVSSALVEPYYTWLTSRALGVPLRMFFVGLAGVVAASAVMAAGVLMARIAVVHAGLAAPGRLAVMIAVGVAVYIPACRVCAPAVTAEIKGQWRNASEARRRRRESPADATEQPLG